VGVVREIRGDPINVDKDVILSCLQRFRSLFSYVADCSDRLIDDLAAFLPTRHMVFPCDIIDLRGFLIKNKISFFSPIPLFSQRFADKYFKEYSIFLVLDSQKTGAEKSRFGGLQLNFAEELDISDSLIRIIVNEPAAMGSFDSVKNIVEEFDIGVECLVSNSVPGLSFPTSRLSTTGKKVFKKGQRVIGGHSELSLTPKEKNIFEFLKTVKKGHGLNIQMRVAGGWVRDKLLGIPSDDIDIAIDMPGYDFAQLVAEAAVRHNIIDVSKAYKVSLEKSADPLEKAPDDKLMVGAVDLFGQKIEFVPMRTEHYPDPNSRQPQITTTNNPKEDVRRRDLTINALYYNIDTGEVDDFVGGKKDLGIEGDGQIVLRTPDESYKTFHEDPLRLLRVLRFHSRFPNSVIDDSIVKAMGDPSIHESYSKKVASERAGPELMKMLMGNPVDSLKLLFSTGLYKSAFKVPEMDDLHPEGIMMNQQTPYHKYNLLDHTLEVVKNMNKIMQDNGESDHMRGLMNLAALFHDFGKMKGGVQKPHPKNVEQMQYIDHERASTKMANQILKSIGVGRDERDIVNQVIRLHMRPHSADKWGPKGRGRFLRDTRMHGKDEEHKDLWKYVLYHVQADDMASQPDNYNEEKHTKFFENFSNFVESPTGIFRGTVINGSDIINIFSTLTPVLSPSTGYIKEVLNRLKELQDTGKIDMSFATMPDGNEKQNVFENSKVQATQAVHAMAPEIINKYREPLMSGNWFKQVKLSQVLPEAIDKLYQDKTEIVKGPKEALPQYQVGMRVRDRRKGMANPQEYGKVDDIKGTQVRIIWNPDNKEKLRKEVFDMIEDTAVLSLIVAEV